MTNPRLIRRGTPLLFATAVVALATSSAPAYAGGDDCADSVAPQAGASRVMGGDECPPAAPAPVRPAPAPVQPRPARPAPAPVVRAPARPRRTTTRHTPQRPVSSRVRPVQTRPVVQRRTFVQGMQSVPRGGVQAGAGGSALPSSTRPSLAIAVAALLLALLVLGAGRWPAHTRSRC